MRGVDILASFELETNKLDETLNKPVTDDSLYWINQAVVKFVKDRFNGNAPKRTSYEQNEKRTRDLIRLLREITVVTYNPTTPSDNQGGGNNTPDNQGGNTTPGTPGTDTPGTPGSNGSNDYLLEELAHMPHNDDFRGIDSDEYTQWYEVWAGDTSREYVRMFDVYGEDSSSTPSQEGTEGQNTDGTEGTTVEDIITEDTTQNTQPTIKQEIQTSNPSYDSYEYKYPSDMMFMLNEDVIISNLQGDYPMNTCVFECTADNFMYRINNKLTDFHYRFHRARPLRVRTRDGFKLLTDKKYRIKAYTLGYLKVPTEITSEDPYKDYTDFDDHIWLEITKIAAQMYIENQSDPRYKTITNEVLTQE